MAAGLKQQTIQGVAWSFIERFSVQSIHFITNIIMARLLTPADYGLIGMLAIFMSLSQVFIDGGLSSALVQTKHRDEVDFSTVFYINFTISLFLYIILFFAASFIASFYNQPLLTSIIRVYALNLIINSLVAVNKTKLVIAVDFKTQSKISLITAVISGCLGIYFAYSGLGVWALVIQMLSAAVVNVIVSIYYVRWYPHQLFSWRSFRRLFRFSSKLLAATIISSIYSNLYTLIIGKRFSASSLGYYTRADQFAQFTGTNISGILTRVCFPVLSSIQDDDNRLLLAYRRYIQVTAFIMFPIILLLCGVAKPLVLVLLGDKWSESIPLLQILSLAYLFNGIVLINLNLLYVKGRSDLVLRLEFIKKSIAFTILIVSMFFGVKAICIGMVVYSLIGFYLNTIYTKKLLRYGFGNQIKDIWQYFVAGTCVYLTSRVIIYIVPINIVSLIAASLFGIMIFFMLCKFMKLQAYNEIITIVNEYRNKK